MDHKQQRLLVSVLGLGVSAYLMYRMLRAYEAMAAPSAQLAHGTALAERLLSYHLPEKSEGQKAGAYRPYRP